MYTVSCLRQLLSTATTTETAATVASMCLSSIGAQDNRICIIIAAKHPRVCHDVDSLVLFLNWEHPHDR